MPPQRTSFNTFSSANLLSTDSLGHLLFDMQMYLIPFIVKGFVLVFARHRILDCFFLRIFKVFQILLMYWTLFESLFACIQCGYFQIFLFRFDFQ